MVSDDRPIVISYMDILRIMRKAAGHGAEDGLRLTVAAMFGSALQAAVGKDGAFTLLSSAFESELLDMAQGDEAREEALDTKWSKIIEEMCASLLSKLNGQRAAV